MAKRLTEQISLQLKGLPLLIGLSPTNTNRIDPNSSQEPSSTFVFWRAGENSPLIRSASTTSMSTSQPEGSPKNLRRSPTRDGALLATPEPGANPSVSRESTPPTKLSETPSSEDLVSPASKASQRENSPDKDVSASVSGSFLPFLSSSAEENRSESVADGYGNRNVSPLDSSNNNSREGSVERMAGGNLADNGSIASLSTKSSEDGTTTTATDFPRNASFNISVGSGNLSLNNNDASSAGGGKESNKKSPGLNPPSTRRHNSDASSVASSTGRSGKSSDKKRQRWYQSLYPTYKQRSEEFIKLFPSIPKTERLLIDYSCALQRDILVQGRLYVSQNHICFYAKIIAWETNICTPWKGVNAMSKEKTAKIIPNAISYATDHEQYYFTSFGQRDKTFTNLYRVWQGAVKDQPMSVQEMWSFIHHQYGDDLGLTSDDEDYVQPAYLRSFPEVMVSINGADDEEQSHTELSASTENLMMGQQSDTGGKRTATSLSKADRSDGVNGSLSSSTSESDRNEDQDEPLYIPAPPVNAQTFIDHEFHISFDQLFLVIFSESTLLKEMYQRRKISETVFGQWSLDPTTDCQVRDVKYCISIGPKIIRTEEHQTLLKESVPGRLHLVDSVAQNHGAPYSDSFSVVTHFCVYKAASNCTRLRVATEVVFRKANWAVKAILEKGVMDQLRDYMADLKGRLSTLEAELATVSPDDEENVAADEAQSALKSPRRSIVRREGNTLSSVSSDEVRRSTLRHRNRSVATSLDDGTASGQQNGGDSFVTQSEYLKVKKLLYLIFVLLVLNVMLYWRVWELPFRSFAGTTIFQDSTRPTGGSDKEKEWMSVIAKFTHPKNQDLLNSINDGLSHVLTGLQKISGALEELHSNLAQNSVQSTPGLTTSAKNDPA